MEKWSVESLQEFESGVAELFNQGKIQAPIHLSDGNESSLIEIFQEVRSQDYLFCSWRSHYQCLLKGVAPDRVKSEIIAGRSIALCFPEFNVYSTAIVGGQLPLAIGAAFSIKRNKGNAHVWCFVGDMTSETGIVQTSIRYAEKHDLPITFIVEDNQLSVLTNTRKVWATNTLRYEEIKSTKVISYQYKNIYPHAGAGKRIQF